MTVTKQKLTSGSFLLGSVIAANILNFGFNAILGRWLSFSDFGIITLLVTFYYVSGLFTNALSASINFNTSSLLSKNKSEAAHSHFYATLRRSILISVTCTLLWFGSVPFLQIFFHLPSIMPLVSFAPMIVFSTIAYACIGYLQGKLNFSWAAVTIISEPITKLFVGVCLALLGAGSVAYFSLPLSLLAAAIVGYICVRAARQGSPVTVSEPARFPRLFFLTSLVTGVSSTLFFSIDLLLVKHFFSPEVMGQYALLSLIGKMMFFFSTLGNVFTLPLVTRCKTLKESRRLFVLLFGSTFSLSLIGWLLLGGLGSIIVPFLFGAKASVIVSLLPTYTLAIGLYALANVTVSFHLARKEYYFSILPLLSSLLFVCLIIFNHQTLEQMIKNSIISASFLAISLAILHGSTYKKGALYDLAS